MLAAVMFLHSWRRGDGAGVRRAAVPDPERVTAIAADAAGLVQVTGSARLRKELMALPRQAAAWRNTPHGRQLRAIVGSVA